MQGAEVVNKSTCTFREKPNCSKQFKNKYWNTVSLVTTYFISISKICLCERYNKQLSRQEER